MCFEVFLSRAMPASYQNTIVLQVIIGYGGVLTTDLHLISDDEYSNTTVC